MKKRIGFITLFCIAISLVGCGKWENSGQNSEVLGEIEYDNFVISDGEKLYRLDENGVPFEIIVDESQEKVDIRDYAQIDNEICVLYSLVGKDYENLADKIAFIDGNTIINNIELEDGIPVYSTVVDAVDGEFYLSYSKYGEDYSYEYDSFVYESNSNQFLETDRFSSVEGMLESHQTNEICYGMSPLEMNKKYGYVVMRNGESDAVFYNLSGEKQYFVTPSYGGMICIDYADENGAVLYEVVENDSISMTYEYYVDFRSKMTFEIGQGSDYRSFAKDRYEDYLIMVENVSDEYGIEDYQYSLFDTTSGENTVLFSNKVYGNSSRISDEYNNSYVIGTILYYQNSIDDRVEWYTCNLGADNYEALPTGVVINENELTKFGSYLHESKTYYFEPGDEAYFVDCFADNGITNYENYFSDNKLKTYAYYVEGFQLNSDIKNADKINTKLKEKFDAKINRDESNATSTRSMYIESGYFPSVYTYSTNDETVYSVSLLGDKYIQIGYLGYDYMGGAHGMPYYDYEMYSLDTSDEITIADLYNGSEEEFADLIAEYSLNVYQNNEELFYPFEADDEEQYLADLYQQFHDGASYDLLGYFTDDSYVVEYYPYEYGPYAAGFIEVPIPLSKLGIKF